MTTSKGRRIASIKEATTIPSGSNFIMELPNGGNSRRATMRTLTKEVYNHLQYGTDADVDAIIAGEYEDPPEDVWEDDDVQGDVGNTDDVATDQEVQDYIENLDLFGN